MEMRYARPGGRGGSAPALPARCITQRLHVNWRRKLSENSLRCQFFQFQFDGHAFWVVFFHVEGTATFCPAFMGIQQHCAANCTNNCNCVQPLFNFNLFYRGPSTVAFYAFDRLVGSDLDVINLFGFQTFFGVFQIFAYIEFICLRNLRGFLDGCPFCAVNHFIAGHTFYFFISDFGLLLPRRSKPKSLIKK